MTGSFRPPPRSDPRWVVAALLSAYLLLGVTVLGFTRAPLQVLCVIAAGTGFDVLLSAVLRRRRLFPLSAYITSLSMSILLEYSLGYAFLWLPVFLAIASKHVLTHQGRHVVNPALFGICASLWLGDGLISLSPAYQWMGSAETAWAMSVFIVTGGVVLAWGGIRRNRLVLSFLVFYALQTGLRAWVMRHHIPATTLFVGSMTSPAFFLFAFFMITDPRTSPDSPRGQVAQGFALAFLDLVFHTQASLYTFFYAGFTVGAARLVWLHLRHLRPDALTRWVPRAAFVLLCAAPVALAFRSGLPKTGLVDASSLTLHRVDAGHSGLGFEKSSILEQTDPRVRNVAKWLLAVGDAVAVADVDLDGRQDLFLTQMLKAGPWRGKLWINEGDFRFRRESIAPLEPYLHDPAVHGLPSTALFLDYDNDGDPDLFVGFAFAPSRLFENRIVPDGRLHFVEAAGATIGSTPTVTLSANALDFDRDGRLDLFVANVLPPHIAGYDRDVPFNVFRLPPSEYEGDRRMLHFMHESWHNSRNGGVNRLWLNRGGTFQATDSAALGLPETHWSLSVGTGDLDGDGWTDLYVASDFGRDDCYRNVHGQRFARQEGTTFGDLGLDPYKGMNSSFGDVDGDGREDVYVSNVHHALQAEGSLLWLNRSRPGVIDLVDRATQLGALNPNRWGWGAAMADLNLDGWLDIVQANGMVGDDWDPRYDHPVSYWYLNEKLARSPPEIHAYSDAWADITGALLYPDEPDRVYLGWNGRQFEDVAAHVGLDARANTRGVAAVDLDDDGDADLVITDQFGAPLLYENRVRGEPRWIGLLLAGNGATTSCDAVGSRVTVVAERDGVRFEQVREVRLANGFSAQGDRRLLFGLGSGEVRVVDVRIDWYGGGTQHVADLAAGRYHTVRQAPSEDRP